MIDPLEHFLTFEPLLKENIKSYTIGARYCIIELNNGNYGVCGVGIFKLETHIPNKIDLNNFSHRHLYTCYLNAIYNPEHFTKPTSSFVDNINSNEFKIIVMIGLFRPLLKRYQKLGISPIIFDLNKDEVGITPMEEQPYWLKKADLVILTGTTIANNTLKEILYNINSSTRVAMAGPSTLLHPYMFELHENLVLSGMLFEPNNLELVKCINEGYGTQHFKKYGKKVDIFNT